MVTRRYEPFRKGEPVREALGAFSLGELYYLLVECYVFAYLILDIDVGVERLALVVRYGEAFRHFKPGLEVYRCTARRDAQCAGVARAAHENYKGYQ